MDESQVFAHALKLAAPVERAAYLAAACGGNSKLQEDVESLLRAHDTNPGFLEQPAAALSMDTMPGPKVDAKAGADLGFLAASDRPDSLGRVAHYEILEVIGRGGMGIVLRALDEKLHRVAAIKVMAAQLATNATARKRFTREAQAAAAVTHDHIVTIYAVDEAAGLPYLVMQYIAGASLQERIDRSGPLQLEEILRIGMQTASGLAAAHAQGLIHRDVKPANILLENGVERVKLTDFGLARAADDANLTQSGMVAGTPHYMSPEQAQGVALDQRSDLFSLGSVMYAMCTGRAPFRANGTVAILKRVCDETPTLVEQINSAIPTWLSAIIEKLHAKDAGQRYQSAAEVVEVLGRYLAYVQHPSGVPQPQSDPAGAKAESAQKISLPNRSQSVSAPWWTVAAVLLVLFFGGLSLTEATGVTRLVPTVIRVLTPDGTLVVETDDPGVRITVEGDGGLTITGAGLEEIRLKPGSYKLHADKNGQRVPLERDVVSIAKGGREVVRVKLETSPRPMVTQVEHGAFVLLAAGQQRKFDTLAEAVQSASDGDTIEVLGNGPFVTQPIKTTNTITIRAGEGFRPVITLSAEASQAEALLQADATLVLEGLEFQRLGKNEKPPYNVIIATKALYAANCRFLTRGVDRQVGSYQGSHAMKLRNCEFLCPAEFRNIDGTICKTTAVFPQAGRTLVLENCVLMANVATFRRLGYPTGAVFRLTHNTYRTPGPALAFNVSPDHSGAENFADEDWTVKTLKVQASDNVFGADAAFIFGQQFVKTVLMPGEAEALLTRMVGWQGERNAYAGDEVFLRLTRVSPTIALPPPKIPAGLAGWKQLWGTTEEGSVEGQVRFEGGDLLAKAESALEKITPDDFRLRADSAGYRAGADGKDLGADVDLVGPGAAYERWKKMPEYQEWLKESGQQE